MAQAGCALGHWHSIACRSTAVRTKAQAINRRRLCCPLTWISRPWVPSLGVIKFPLHHCGSARSRFPLGNGALLRWGVGKHNRYLPYPHVLSLKVSNCIVQIPPALELACQSLDGGEVPRECRIAWRIGQAIRQMATVRVAGSSSKLLSLCKRRSQGP
jgi:hypothetical protein